MTESAPVRSLAKTTSEPFPEQPTASVGECGLRPLQRT